MQLSLSPKPSLTQLKKQAKEILKAHKAGDAACLPVVRRLRQFADRPDTDVFAGKLALNDVQLALALCYGYEGWANLKRHIENVEAGERAPKLTKQPGEVCIHGLEQMDWGGSFFRRQDSFMTVLAACLRSMGLNTSFEDVMGVSSGAFGLNVARGLCPSAARIGGDCFDRAQKAFGVTVETIELDEGKNAAGVKRLREAAVASIDRGVPVPYMDGEFSLIVGYNDAGRAYICHAYDGGKGYREMDFPRGMLGPAWFANVVTRAGQPMDRTAAVRESLRAAVAMSGGDPQRPGSAGEDEEGQYHGFAAYEKWIECLESPPENVNLHGNAYGYAILLTNRAAAAEYLAAVAREFDGPAAESLTKAGGRYRSVMERLLAGRDCVAHPWRESWTPENRAIEADIMRRNLADKKVAITEIEEVLGGIE